MVWGSCPMYNTIISVTEFHETAIYQIYTKLKHYSQINYILVCYLGHKQTTQNNNTDRKFCLLSLGQPSTMIIPGKIRNNIRHVWQNLPGKADVHCKHLFCNKYPTLENIGEFPSNL